MIFLKIDIYEIDVSKHSLPFLGLCVLKFKVTTNHYLCLASCGGRGTRAYWTLMPHKESGRLFSFLHLPPLPSSPPPKRGKVRTACQSRKKGRFDSNKNRLSNHLVLSSPDSGEEWCVRKSRKPRMRVMASSLDFAISSTSDLARPPLVSRNLLPHSDYVSVRNISMGCIKNGIQGQRDGSVGKGTCFLAWPPEFNPQDPQSTGIDSFSQAVLQPPHVCFGTQMDMGMHTSWGDCFLKWCSQGHESMASETLEPWLVEAGGKINVFSPNLHGSLWIK